MGHKVNPKSFRMGGIYTWGSKWFARRKDYAGLVKEDVTLRKFIFENLKEAGIDSVEFERKREGITIIINAAKPGIVIGRSGAGSDSLKKKIKDNFFRGRKMNLNINIFEVKKPALSAHIVAQGVVEEIEKRVPFRKVMKQAIEKVKKAGAKGVKISLGGRLNGAEIARTEKMIDGSVPLQNLRADIDFAYGTAKTIYGAIGIKVWIYRGEVFDKKEKEKETEAENK